MSYLPRLRGELVRVAERRPEVAGATPHPRSRRARWVRWPRARGSRLRWVAINLALGLVGTVGGLSAAGVFDRGTPLGPPVAPPPNAAEGAAIPGSARLLGLRTPDPGGGLPWGLRVVRTTRGLECVDVGRVDFGTIGVLGQDGAFHDDGRFHPISANVFGDLGCATRDAHGHAFVNVALQNQPTSGLAGLPGETGKPNGCEPAELTHDERRPTCSQADMREIYLGLLGPDARSVTYRAPGGGQRTVATVGSQGAYLIVLPQATSGCLAPSRPGEAPARRCPYGGRGNRGGPEVPSGVISTVAYRDGHVCHVASPGTRQSLFGSCPPLGFVKPSAPRPTHAQLATPISVRELPARHYCAKARGEGVMLCERRVPVGYRRLNGGWPSLLVQIEFTARVAITDGGSWYEIEINFPRSHSCGAGGAFGPTDYDIRAGERVHYRTFVPYRCHGPARGAVTYMSTVGAAGAMPVPGLPGEGKPVLVGRFAFRVPRAAR